MSQHNVNLRVRTNRPAFIEHARQTLDFTPTAFIKAPDGPLNRAAVHGLTLANKRRAVSQPHDGPPAWDEAIFKASKKDDKLTDVSTAEQEQFPPIHAFRDELVAAIRDHPVLVLVGEPGTGKTTQVVQYLAQAGFGRVGVTQTRWRGAMAAAQRVVVETGVTLGQEVGYAIRNKIRVRPETKIKYITDGLLLRDCVSDPLASEYAAVIVDDADERTVPTDVLLGVLKRASAQRPELRIVVCASSLDINKILGYFDNAPVFTVPGLRHQVRVKFLQEPVPDYLDASINTVIRIHQSQQTGDILLFVASAEETDVACGMLYERTRALGSSVSSTLSLIPVYAATPAPAKISSQLFAVTPPGSRKVVVATHAQGTRLPIPGVSYIVDPGFNTRAVFDAQIAADVHLVLPISQAEARERTACAGKTARGTCFRLYTRAAFEGEMFPSTLPDIQRISLRTSTLAQKALGLNYTELVDAPPGNMILHALEALYALGALDDTGNITALGRCMVVFPIDRRVTAMLGAAAAIGCSDEVLSLAALLSVPPIFEAEGAVRLHHPGGDQLTLLAAYDGWVASDCSDTWCTENRVQAQSMRQAQTLRERLAVLVIQYGLGYASSSPGRDSVRRAVCAGLTQNAAKLHPDGSYRTLVQDRTIRVHPLSALANRSPKWIVYDEVDSATSLCRLVCAIEPQWLVEDARHIFEVLE
jgi:ATP-dependent RNA helicase DHX8/PRP22